MVNDARKRTYSFMIDADLALELKRVKARDGVAEGEQIRRALRKWFGLRTPSAVRPPSKAARRHTAKKRQR